MFKKLFANKWVNLIGTAALCGAATGALDHIGHGHFEPSHLATAAGLGAAVGAVNLLRQTPDIPLPLRGVVEAFAKRLPKQPPPPPTS